MDDAEIEAQLASGGQREALQALRERLADGVVQATDRRLIHLAPLAKQFMDVIDKIEKLPDAGQGDELDDLVARRAARRAASQAG